jgi:hypothetical protein
MTTNNLLNSTQHGFFGGKSCTTKLLEFMEVAIRAVNEVLSRDVVYLDFAKALDKVPRKRLVKETPSPWDRRASPYLDRGLADRQRATCGYKC